MRYKYFPYFVIFLSFFVLIFLTSFLLFAPFTHHAGKSISYLDAFFTSTSVVTLTGLTTININEIFNIWGILTIMLMIEISSLTIITLLIFLLDILGFKIGLSAKTILKENISSNSFRDIEHIMKDTLIAAAIIQGFGFIFNIFVFLPNTTGFFPLILEALFHTISTFANVGMSVTKDLTIYHNNPAYIISTSLMIVLGRMGFPVIFDLVKNKKFSRLNLNSKICIKTGLIISAVGFLVITLTNLNHNILDSFYLMIIGRSGGLYTKSLATINNSGDFISYDLAFSNFSLFIVYLLMFIGGSPASTSGGMKTTPLYTVYKSFSCYISKNKPMASQKFISDKYQIQSYSIFTFCLLICIFSGAMLMITNPEYPVFLVIFEACSAFTNNGLTLGLTSIVGFSGKIVLIITMFIGRLGVMTCLHLLKFKRTQKGENIKYIEGEYILG